MYTEQLVTAAGRRGPGISGELGMDSGKAFQRGVRGVIPQFTDAALQFGELIDRRPVGRIIYDTAAGSVVQPFSWFMRGFMEATGKNAIPWIDLQTQRRDGARSSLASLSAAELAKRLKSDPIWPGPYNWGQQRVAVVTPTITSGETVNTVTRAIRLAMLEDNGRIRAHPAIDIITTHFNGLNKLPSYEGDTIGNNRQRTIIDLEHRGIPLGSGGRVYASEQVDSENPMDRLVAFLEGDQVDGVPIHVARTALYRVGMAAGNSYTTHDLDKMLLAAQDVVDIALV